MRVRVLAGEREDRVHRARGADGDLVLALALKPRRAGVVGVQVGVRVGAVHDQPRRDRVDASRKPQRPLLLLRGINSTLDRGSIVWKIGKRDSKKM